MKRLVNEVIGTCWIYGMEDGTVQAAIAYLSQFPQQAMLTIDYGYEGIDGSDVVLERLETDEEEAKREALEYQMRVEQEARLRLAQETQATKMARYALEEVALHAYLKMHEGNPKINDLENLFRALQGLESEGKAGTSVQALKDCMKGIENYGAD